MRVANRIATALLGLVLIAAGLWAAVEAVLAALKRPPLAPMATIHDRLTSTTYADDAVRWVTIGLIALGLIVLLLQLRRWRPREVDVGKAEAEDAAQWQVRRTSVEETVAASVGALPGVREAQASVQGGPHSWRMRVRAWAATEQKEQVAQAARRALDRLAVPNTVDLTVNVRSPGRVS